MPGMAVMPAKRPRTQDTRRSTNDVSITDLVGSRWARLVTLRDREFLIA